MKLEHQSRLRLPAYALAAVLALGPSSPSVSAQVPTPPVIVVSGLSIHDSFYERLEVKLDQQLSERTGTYQGVPFYPYMEAIEDQFEEWTVLFAGGIAAAITYLVSFVPAIGGWLALVWGLFQAFVFAQCQGGLSNSGVELSADLARVFGFATLAANPVDWQQLSDGTGQEPSDDGERQTAKPLFQSGHGLGHGRL